MGQATARRRGDLLELVWEGHLTGDDIVRVIAELQGLMRGARTVVADARGVTSFDKSARARAVDLVTFFRESGLEHAVTITGSAMLRLAGATVALASRMPVDFAETPEQAERIVAQRRAREQRNRGTAA